MKTVPQEWVVLSSTLSKLPTIKQDRVSPRRLFNASRRKRAFVLIEKESHQIYAFGALWPTRRERWLEIGTIWVDKKFGKQWLSKQIITHLYKKAQNRQKSVFLCCSEKNEKMQEVVISLGFKPCDNPRKSPLAKVWGNRDTSGRKIFYFEHTS